jgi:chromodomain-helicase-DNA-binding protein 1
MAALPPSTSNPTSIPLHNGHMSPSPRELLNGSHPAGEHGRSNTRDSRLSQPTVQEFMDDPHAQNANTSDDAPEDEDDVGDDVDADADADGDFDVETPPQVPSISSPDEDFSSEESIRPPKRKTLHEENHIINNPELYGLRRSVSCEIYLLLTYADTN